MEASPIKIMLVDDHIVMRMGLVTATQGEDDMEVVVEAENGVEALEAYRVHKPDVVVLDLRMPKKGGIETIQDIRAEFPGARILVFSNYANGDEISKAFDVGASGFVVKEMSLGNLLEGIRQVHRGEKYIPADIARKVSRQVLSHLSPRELEVLGLVAKGMSNKGIAAELDLVEGTVKIHLNRILAKLGVSDRTQAVLAAVRMGIVQLD